MSFAAPLHTISFSGDQHRTPTFDLGALLRDRRRGEPRFATLMFLQWIAAVLASMYCQPGSPGHLLFLLLTGGAATAVCAAVTRWWPEDRTARAATGLCQMLFAVGCMHIFGNHPALQSYSYGSLVLVSLYADWTALATACAVACCNVFFGAVSLQALAAGHLVVSQRAGGEIVSLLLCTGLLSYVANERRNEVAEATAHREKIRYTLYRAFHDACTGLPNRAALESRMEEWMQHDGSLTCLWMEIEGICAGGHSPLMRNIEALVRSVADRLQHVIESDDLVSRVGNDKFCVLTNRDCTREELTAMAERVVHAIGQPHAIAGLAPQTGVNIGIARMHAGLPDLDALLMTADRAMRVAKSDERNQFRFAEDLSAAVDQRNLLLAQKLQQALQQGGLRLVYQPIFNADRQMIAVEALARWTDPEEGEISPGEFIPAAEANGLIVPFSKWVMHRACAQMAEWLALDTTLQRMAVNVSVKQVWRSDFVATVERMLRETGLEPRHLEVEVTEGALAADFEPVKRNLQALRRLGVRISIDDFGTGYSSLSRVRELEADVLKIDRAFVRDASESAGGAAMVQAIIDMAHSMQLSVIAEGVETADQLQLLNAMSCDEIQGFLLARPQPPETLTAEMRGVKPRPQRLLTPQSV